MKPGQSSRNGVVCGLLRSYYISVSFHRSNTGGLEIISNTQCVYCWKTNKSLFSCPGKKNEIKQCQIRFDSPNPSTSKLLLASNFFSGLSIFVLTKLKKVCGTHINSKELHFLSSCSPWFLYLKCLSLQCNSK